MTQNKKKWIFIVGFVIALIIIGKVAYFTIFKTCGDCGNTSDNNSTINKMELERIINGKEYKNITIVYSSDNGSLPPQYHREYTITVSENAEGVTSGRSVVKDYEKVLEEKTISVDDGQFEALMSELLKIGPPSSDDKLFGCTGGTGKSLRVFKEQKTILATSSYSCAGESTNKSLEEFDPVITNILHITLGT